MPCWMLWWQWAVTHDLGIYRRTGGHDPEGGTPLFPRKKYELIESVLEDFGSESDWQTLREALPPLVADHEIRLVRAGW